MDAEVIIVGGRPAGASLATRLGQRGVRTLVLERAEHPSPPNVPSCPVLYPSGLAMLDELGIPEARYSAGSLRFADFSLAFEHHFTAHMRMPRVHGRDYVYSIPRPCFDEVMWEHLAGFPSVTRRRFAVSGLLRDGERVVGVEGREPGGPREELRARWVIGADGRFSSVASWVGSRVVEESAEKVSTVYFADWEGVGPAEPGPRRVRIHNTGKGLAILYFPLPDGRTTVCTHARADRVPDGDGDGYYRATLQGIGPVAESLGDARQVGKLYGMKRVGNGYRAASGPGWLLVGDAFHYKDPVDGQGIYDAFLGTKIAAEEIARSLAGECDDAAAGAAYAKRAYDATHPMFVATCKRLATELYGEPPVPVIRTLLRWMLTDPAYQDRFLRFLSRDIDPATWTGPRVMLGAALRGIGRDLTGRSAPRIGTAA